MLRKLIKHEWKSFSKVGSIMLLSVLAVTIIGCLMMQLPGWEQLASESSNLTDFQEFAWVMTAVISFMLYVFMLVGLSYGIMIYMGVHFYKSTYTGQGYLVHTLPVTQHQILGSKIFVSGMWYFLIQIGILLSAGALIVSFMAGVLDVNFADVWAELMAAKEEIAHALETELGTSMLEYFAVIILSVVIGPFASASILFAAITIGQLSRKYKALMGILAYFGIMVIQMIVSMVVQMVITFKYSLEQMSNPNAVGSMDMSVMYDFSLIMVIIMGVGLYFVAHYIMSKKLNMD